MIVNLSVVTFEPVAAVSSATSRPAVATAFTSKRSLRWPGWKERASGTFRFTELLDTSTWNESLAGVRNRTSQITLCPATRNLGLQDKEIGVTTLTEVSEGLTESSGLTRFTRKVATLVTLPSDALRITKPDKLLSAVNANVALLLPAGIVTEAGARKSSLLDFRLTTAPLLMAVNDTVHLPVIPGIKVAGAQAMDSRLAGVTVSLVAAIEMAAPTVDAPRVLTSSIPVAVVLDSDAVTSAITPSGMGLAFSPVARQV